MYRYKEIDIDEFLRSFDSIEEKRKVLHAEIVNLGDVECVASSIKDLVQKHFDLHIPSSVRPTDEVNEEVLRSLEPLFNLYKHTGPNAGMVKENVTDEVLSVAEFGEVFTKAFRGLVSDNLAKVFSRIIDGNPLSSKHGPVGGPVKSPKGKKLPFKLQSPTVKDKKSAGARADLPRTFSKETDAVIYLLSNRLALRPWLLLMKTMLTWADDCINGKVVSLHANAFCLLEQFEFPGSDAVLREITSAKATISAREEKDRQQREKEKKTKHSEGGEGRSKRDRRDKDRKDKGASSSHGGQHEHVQSGSQSAQLASRDSSGSGGSGSGRGISRSSSRDGTQHPDVYESPLAAGNPEYSRRNQRSGNSMLPRPTEEKHDDKQDENKHIQRDIDESVWRLAPSPNASSAHLDRDSLRNRFSAYKWTTERLSPDGGSPTDSQIYARSALRGISVVHDWMRSYLDLLKNHQNIALWSTSVANSAPALFVDPHAVNFLLVNNCLQHIAQSLLHLEEKMATNEFSKEERNANTAAMTCEDVEEEHTESCEGIAFSTSSASSASTQSASSAASLGETRRFLLKSAGSLLRLLRVNIAYANAKGIAPVKLALKYIPPIESGKQCFVARLLATLLYFSGLDTKRPSACQDMSHGGSHGGAVDDGHSDPSYEVRHLYEEVRTEAMNVVSGGFNIFFPESSDWQLLLRLCRTPKSPGEIFMEPPDHSFGSPEILRKSIGNESKENMKSPTQSPKKRGRGVRSGNGNKPWLQLSRETSEVSVESASSSQSHTFAWEGNPVLLLAALPAKAKQSLLPALCEHLRKAQNACLVVPREFRVATHSVNSSLEVHNMEIFRDPLMLKSWSAVHGLNVIPCIGEVVVLGPDWRYPMTQCGSQYHANRQQPIEKPHETASTSSQAESGKDELQFDANVSVRGIVIDVVMWSERSISNDAVVVMWGNGSRHTYCFGYGGHYEVSLLRPPQRLDMKKGGKVELWTLPAPEEIEAGLDSKIPTNQVTKRSVLLKILDNSPTEWLRANKLDRSLQNILRSFDVTGVRELYRRFYEDVVEPAQLKEGPSKSKDSILNSQMKTMDDFIFFSRALMEVSSSLKEYNALTVKEAANTLYMIQSTLLGLFGQSDSDLQSKLDSSSRQSSPQKSGGAGRMKKWAQATSKVSELPLGRPTTIVVAYCTDLIKAGSTLLQECYALLSDNETKPPGSPSKIHNASQMCLSNPLLTRSIPQMLSALLAWHMPISRLHKREFEALLQVLEIFSTLIVQCVEQFEIENVSAMGLQELLFLTYGLAGRIAADMIHGGCTSEYIGNLYFARNIDIFARYPIEVRTVGDVAESGHKTTMKHEGEPGRRGDAPTAILNETDLLQKYLKSQLLKNGFKRTEHIELGRQDACEVAYQSIVDSVSGKLKGQIAVNMRAWISNHRPKFPLALTETLQDAMDSLVLATLYHRGYLDATLAFHELLIKYPISMELKPPEFLLEVWTAAETVRSDFFVTKRSGADPGHGLAKAEEYARMVAQRAQFLLLMESSSTRSSFMLWEPLMRALMEKKKSETTKSEIESFLRRIDATIRNAEMFSTSAQEFTESISLDVASFAKNNAVSLIDIHRSLIFSKQKVQTRIDGFQMVQRYLSLLPLERGRGVQEAASTLLCQFKASLHLGNNACEWFPPSCLLANATRYFPFNMHRPAKYGNGGDAPLCVMPKQITSNAHYADGIVGIPTSSHRQLVASFERILTSLLSSLLCILSQDTDQLKEKAFKSLFKLLVSCWGIQIFEDDHNILSRIHFFDSIKEALGLLLYSESPVNMTTPDCNTGEEYHSYPVDMTLVKATFKLLYYYVIQVAATGELDDTTEAPDSDIDEDEEDENNVIAAPPIRLRHAVSGPETLSDTVFEMLYIQFAQSLSKLLERVRSSRVPLGTVTHESPPDPVPLCTKGHDMEKSAYNKGPYRGGWVCNFCRKHKTDERWWCAKCHDDYCYSCRPASLGSAPLPQFGGCVVDEEGIYVVREVLQLITTCAGRSPNCRRILSKPRWVSSLLHLAVDCPTILDQQRALQLLSLLLQRTNMTKYIENGARGNALNDDLHECITYHLGNEMSARVRKADPAHFLVNGIIHMLLSICKWNGDARFLMLLREEDRAGNLPKIERMMTDSAAKHKEANAEAIYCLRSLLISPFWRPFLEKIIMSNFKAFLEHFNTKAPSENDPPMSEPSILMQTQIMINLLGGMSESLLYPGCTVISHMQASSGKSYKRLGTLVCVKGKGNSGTATVIFEASSAKNVSVNKPTCRTKEEKVPRKTIIGCRHTNVPDLSVGHDIAMMLIEVFVIIISNKSFCEGVEFYSEDMSEQEDKNEETGTFPGLLETIRLAGLRALCGLLESKTICSDAVIQKLLMNNLGGMMVQATSTLKKIDGFDDMYSVDHFLSHAMQNRYELMFKEKLEAEKKALEIKTQGESAAESKVDSGSCAAEPSLTMQSPNIDEDFAEEGAGAFAEDNDNPDPEVVETLLTTMLEVGIGSEGQCRMALTLTAYNIDEAINLIVSGGIPEPLPEPVPAPVPPPAPPSTTVSSSVASQMVSTTTSSVVEELMRAAVGPSEQPAMSNHTTNSGGCKEESRKFSLNPRLHTYSVIHAAASVESDLIGSIFPGEELDLVNSSFDVNAGARWVEVYVDRYVDLACDDLEDEGEEDCENACGRKEDARPSGWIYTDGTLIMDTHSSSNERWSDLNGQIFEVQPSMCKITSKGLLSIYDTLNNEDSSTRFLIAGDVVVVAEEGVDYRGSLKLHILQPQEGWIRKLSGRKSNVLKLIDSDGKPQVPDITPLQLLSGLVQDKTSSFLDDSCRDTGLESKSEHALNFAKLSDTFSTVEEYNRAITSVCGEGTVMLIRKFLLMLIIRCSMSTKRGENKPNAALLSSAVRACFVYDDAKQTTQRLLKFFHVFIRVVGFRSNCLSATHAHPSHLDKCWYLDGLDALSAVEGFVPYECLLANFITHIFFFELPKHPGQVALPPQESPLPHEAIQSTVRDCKMIAVDSIVNLIRTLLVNENLTLYGDGDERTLLQVGDMHYARWLSEILLECMASSTQSLYEHRYHVNTLAAVWVLALRSVKCSVKMISMYMASKIMNILVAQCRASSGPEAGWLHELASNCYHIIPISNVKKMAKYCLQRERDFAPNYSSFLQRLLDFLVDADSLTEMALRKGCDAKVESIDTPAVAPSRFTSRSVLDMNEASFARIHHAETFKDSWTVEVLLYRQPDSDITNAQAADVSADLMSRTAFTEKTVERGGKFRLSGYQAKPVADRGNTADSRSAWFDSRSSWRESRASSSWGSINSNPASGQPAANFSADAYSFSTTVSFGTNTPPASYSTRLSTGLATLNPNAQAFSLPSPPRSTIQSVSTTSAAAAAKSTSPSTFAIGNNPPPSPYSSTNAPGNTTTTFDTGSRGAPSVLYGSTPPTSFNLGTDGAPHGTPSGRGPRSSSHKSRYMSSSAKTGRRRKGSGSGSGGGGLSDADSATTSASETEDLPPLGSGHISGNSVNDITKAFEEADIGPPEYLRGPSVDAGVAGVEAPTDCFDKDPVADAKDAWTSRREVMRIPSLTLLSSSEGVLLLQCGGILWNRSSKSQGEEGFVPQSAQCLAFVDRHGEIHCFDYMVPVEEWVSLAISYDAKCSSMKLVVNGGAIDSLNAECRIPLECLGLNTYKVIERRDSVENVGVRARIAGVRVWRHSDVDDVNKIDMATHQHLGRYTSYKLGRKHGSEIMRFLLDEEKGNIFFEQTNPKIRIRAKNCTLTQVTLPAQDLATSETPKKAQLVENDFITASSIAEKEIRKCSPSSSASVTLPGILQRTGFPTKKEDFSDEVVTVSYSISEDDIADKDSDTVCKPQKRIQGVIEWCRRDIQTDFAGCVSLDNSVTFQIDPGMVRACGSAERSASELRAQTEWMKKGIVFRGRLNESSHLEGEFFLLTEKTKDSHLGNVAEAYRMPGTVELIETALESTHAIDTIGTQPGTSIKAKCTNDKLVKSRIHPYTRSPFPALPDFEEGDLDLTPESVRKKMEDAADTIIAGVSIDEADYDYDGEGGGIFDDDAEDNYFSLFGELEDNENEDNDDEYEDDEYDDENDNSREPASAGEVNFTESEGVTSTKSGAGTLRGCNPTPKSAKNAKKERPLPPMNVDCIHSKQGGLWLDWLVISGAESKRSSRISIGLCAQAAGMELSSDIWSYTEEKAGSVAGLTRGDVLSLQFDSNRGTIHFFKNYVLVKTEEGLLLNHNVSMRGPKRGLQPYVCVGRKNDQVVFQGLRTGRISIEYDEDDVENRKRFDGILERGLFNGPGILTYQGHAGYWWGQWFNGVQHGVQLWIEPDADAGADAVAGPWDNSGGTDAGTDSASATRTGSSSSSATALSVTAYLYCEGEQMSRLQGRRDLWMEALQLTDADLVPPSHSIYNPDDINRYDPPRSADVVQEELAAIGAKSRWGSPAADDAIKSLQNMTPSPQPPKLMPLDVDALRQREFDFEQTILKRREARKKDEILKLGSARTSPLSEDPGLAKMIELAEDTSAPAAPEIEEKSFGKFTCTTQYPFLLNSWHGCAGPSVSTDFQSCGFRARQKGKSQQRVKKGSGRQFGSDHSGMVIGSRGFSSGVHYWEVQIDLSQSNENYNYMTEPHIFIGATRRSGYVQHIKHGGEGRWSGYGIVNNFSSSDPDGTLTTYGEMMMQASTIGVLLDMNRGVISFLRIGDSGFTDKIMVKDFGVAYSCLHSSSRPGPPGDGERYRYSRSSRYGRSSARTEAINTTVAYSKALTLYPCFGFCSAGETLTLLSSWIECDALQNEDPLHSILSAKKLMRSWRHAYSANFPPPVSDLCEKETNLQGHHFTPNVLRAIYADYRRLRNQPTDSKTVLSRGGVPVQLRTAAAEIAAATKDITPGGLRAGSMLRVRSQRGNESRCTILGVGVGPQAAVQVWYSMENNAISGAWYWDVAYLREMISNNSDLWHGIEVISTDGEDCDVGVTSPPGPVPLSRIASRGSSGGAVLEPLRINELTYGECCEEIDFGDDAGWTLDCDLLLVSMVNASADKYDLSPYCVTLQQLQQQLYQQGRRVKQQVEAGTCQSALDILEDKSPDQLLARYAMLCVLNKAVEKTLPFTELQKLPLHERFSRALTPLTVSEAKFRRHYPHIPFANTNTCYSGSQQTAGMQTYELLKRLVFTRSKIALWKESLALTTTPTRLPAESWEYPSDVPEFQVNSNAAKKLLDHIKNLKMCSRELSPLEQRLDQSLFGQMKRNFSRAGFAQTQMRRAYVHDLDLGQQRAFRIAEQGVYVDDSGGPYRAFFEHVLSAEVCELLELMVPCPNALNGRGRNQDKVVINTALFQETSGSPQLSTHFPDALTLYWFVGALSGIACRHGLLVPLSLPELIIKPLVGDALDIEDVFAVDAAYAADSRRLCEDCDRVDSSLVLSSTSDDPVEGPTVESGAGVPVSMSRRPRSYSEAECTHSLRVELKRLLKHAGYDTASATQIVKMSFSGYSALYSGSGLGSGFGSSPSAKNDSLRLRVQRALSVAHQRIQTTQCEALAAFLQGLGMSLPTKFFPLFDSSELDATLCGTPDFSVTVLKEATVYNKVSPSNRHVQILWKVLEEEFDAVDRSAFASFCCARSRLPFSASDFKMPFTIQLMPPQDSALLEEDGHGHLDDDMTGLPNSGAEEAKSVERTRIPSETHMLTDVKAGLEDLRLPTARACFFTLNLPRYSSIEACRDRLLYAIRNANTMDDETS